MARSTKNGAIFYNQTPSILPSQMSLSSDIKAIGMLFYPLLPFVSQRYLLFFPVCCHQRGVCRTTCSKCHFCCQPLCASGPLTCTDVRGSVFFEACAFTTAFLEAEGPHFFCWGGGRFLLFPHPRHPSLISMSYWEHNGAGWCHRV